MALSDKAKAFCVDNLLGQKPEPVGTSTGDISYTARLESKTTDRPTSLEIERRADSLKKEGDGALLSEKDAKKAQLPKSADSGNKRPPFCFCHGDIAFCHHPSVLTVQGIY